VGALSDLMDGILRDFVIETSENLDAVDSGLVRFEQEPDNLAMIGQIFRLVHTIKGTCGFLGLPRLEALAHAAESVIDRFRDGAPVTREAVSLILGTIDRIKVIIAALEATQAEPPGNDNDLISALEGLVLAPAPQPSVAAAPVAEPLVSPDFATGQIVYQVLERPLRPGEVSLDELEEAFRATPGPDQLELSPDLLSRAGLKDTAARETPREPAPPAEADMPAESSAARASVRVNISTLEHLMTMVSELVLTRNQLVEISRRSEQQEFKAPLQRLSQVTAELQESVMKTRMQPIGAAWAKLPRLIRDLEGETGKQFDFEAQGADTEIDRQVLELIKDPLVHMVRNAADHGIESPAERVAAGKAPRGSIRITAAQQGGHISLELSDDGRGLDIPRIRDKALARGLTTPRELEKLTESQIGKFIFHPGFSTAAKLTSISGRGVGMDVVRANIEQVGGTIELANRIGKGLTVSIKIPLTLAIAAALVVKVGEQRFALPQVSVVELVRVRTSSDARIESVHGSPLLRLRERLLPVIPLSRFLGTGESATALEDAYFVVCQVGALRFGLAVDQVLNVEEIVVKPLSLKLRDLTCYSGTTILGDGSVIMILDPAGLAATLGGAAAQPMAEEADQYRHEDGATTSLLVFRAGTGGYKAVPLALVTRLEEIDAARIERANGQKLVQYRGKLMPLVPANSNMAERAEGTQPVLVFSHGQRTTGLMVDEIIDIVDDAMDIDVGGREPGTVGSAIVRGHATDIIDLAHFMDLEDATGERAPRRAAEVLLVDTSDFFRALLAPVLKAAGYRVTVSASARDAGNRLQHRRFDAVVVDLDGDAAGMAELAGRVRATATTPFIGMATRAAAPLLASIRAAGFADVVGRLDRDGLLASLTETLDTRREAA
jgi:two-component system chemotaxis sensor kinase CheA